MPICSNLNSQLKQNKIAIDKKEKKKETIMHTKSGSNCSAM